jgi:hypothetical protein
MQAARKAAVAAALVAASLFTLGCSDSAIILPLPDPLPSARWTIKAENAKPGSKQWHLTNPAKHREIEGYASATSVDRGQDISIFVNTADPTYTLQVFRMGWYGGFGGREMMDPVTLTGIRQPMPSPDPETHLIECHWTDPYVLHIPNSSDPTDWASGIYLVKLTAGTSGKESYVIFVVRDDERSSDLLLQLTIATYEAYNPWGGWSLYTQPRSYAVSFNRPNHEGGGGAGFFFEWEYNMVRFLEREGYDVAYSTNVDTDLRGQLILQHKAFLSVGHDEYWSRRMLDNVTQARDSGVNIGFFGADEANWQIRFQPSDITGDPDRTIVCYKSATLDPFSQNPETGYLTTTHFRDPPVNHPQGALTGVMYLGWFDGPSRDMVVTDASSWIFRNTGLQKGTHLTGLLGYEVDRIFPGHPSGLRGVAHSPWIGVNNRTFYSDMTYYIARSGSTVVSTGSMDWVWGLDDFHWDHPVLTNPAVQQATRNIFTRFGATDPAEIKAP